MEQALEQHPDVLEASVVGLPDDRLGEIPAAAVRLAGGATARRRRTSRRGPSERLADYKVPKRWLAVDDLPRTGTVKVKKAELVALFD